MWQRGGVYFKQISQSRTALMPSRLVRSLGCLNKLQWPDACCAVRLKGAADRTGQDRTGRVEAIGEPYPC